MADRYRDGVPVVDLRGAVALLGNFPALAGVDLTVEPGEIVLVRGPNGAGKTTLLRLCAGLVRPEAGSVEVLGHDLVHERRSVRRRVALLGHATGLYDDLTVVQNVHFWARAAGLSAEEATDRVGVAMVRLGVAERLFGQPVHTLSAGQRRRASLATLVVRRPELWLLDEPHAGLDQAGRDVVDVLIGDAVASGATVLVSSHELDRVAVLGPRVVTIAGGVVVDDTGRGDGGGSRG
ncbi:MAG: heme ABC exporter ATP-binding protein CcmA [Acidimicrobiales bacterium]|nr:heme ABC exporter ATP-binding protein CcmA [Acidimicrobiales bacterium]|tara:strand:- start:109 stop:816 length:708 start_codon:yes stop_codon:yes gene_type:complete